MTIGDNMMRTWRRPCQEVSWIKEAIHLLLLIHNLDVLIGDRTLLSIPLLILNLSHQEILQLLLLQQ